MSDATITGNRAHGNVWKGLVAGLVGGLVASWTMNRFQDVGWSFRESGDLAGAQSNEGKDSEQEQAADSDGDNDDTTVKAASAISQGILITS